MNAVMKFRWRITPVGFSRMTLFFFMELSYRDVDGFGIAELRAGRLNVGLLAGEYSDLSSSLHCP